MAERPSNLSSKSPWQSPRDLPNTLAAERGVIDVWRVSLDVADDVVRSLADSLDDEELTRANRFRIESKRVEFIVTRSCLRAVLAGLLSADCDRTITPRDVTFDYEHHGKPTLSGDWRAFDIQFNATHSYGIALIAATRATRIGIDVERLRENRDVVSLASRWFSNAEVEQLRSLPVEQHVPAFFRGWTRKEAFVKAIGDGITYGLDQFDVALSPAEPAALLQIKGAAADGWQLCHLDPSDDHVAAVAVDAVDVSLRCWDDSALIQR